MKKLKLRGFKLTRKIFTSFKLVLRPRKKLTHLPNPVTGIISLARHFCGRVKTLSCSDPASGYIQLGKEKPVEVVPKGHLAVYFGGESSGETRRAVVPVVYVNHPLFGELLKEAESVYGYNQPGRIVIPCGYSEFEKVKMRIAAWNHCHKGSQWRHRQESKYSWS